MNKSFGDAFVVELEGRKIRCLTSGVSGSCLSAHHASGFRRLHPDRTRTIQRTADQPEGRKRIVVSEQADWVETGALRTEDA